MAEINANDPIAHQISGLDKGHVRTASERDREEIVRVYKSSWLDHLSPRLRKALGAEAERIDFAARWPAELNNTKRQTFCYVDNHNRIIGVGIAEILENPKHGHLRYLYVDPAAQGAGAGKAIIEQAALWLFQQGADSIRNMTIVAEQPRQRWIDFWLRHGGVLTKAEVQMSSYKVAGKAVPIRLVGVDVPNLGEFLEIVNRQKPTITSAAATLSPMLSCEQGWQNLTQALVSPKLPLTISVAVPDDMEGIVAVHRAAWLAAKSHVWAHPKHGYDLASIDFDQLYKKDYLFSPDHHLLVAKDSAGKVIGFGLGQINADESGKKIGQFKRLFVDPAHQNLGVMKNILSGLTEWFKAEQVTGLTICTSRYSHPAWHKFWLQHGFVPSHDEYSRSSYAVRGEHPMDLDVIYALAVDPQSPMMALNLLQSRLSGSAPKISLPANWPDKMLSDAATALTSLQKTRRRMQIDVAAAIHLRQRDMAA